MGKSSFLNMMADQEVALTSEVPGTTTDIVEKAMELLPVGPVMFLDTAGIDDVSALSEKRIGRTKTIFDRAEIAVLIVDPNDWGKYEDDLIHEFEKNEIPYMIVVNRIDEVEPQYDFIRKVESITKNIAAVSCTDLTKREFFRELVKSILMEIIPEDFRQQKTILGDLIKKDDLVVLICPIDSEAPKGRLILPQVQTIRDILDNDAVSIVIKETEYPNVLEALNIKPALVVCDSQVVGCMAANTPREIKCTTFSILFSRLKGDIFEDVHGASAIDRLEDGDKVLIAEACTHHPSEDDIGRVKIPLWLRNYNKKKVIIDVAAGREYPDNLDEYSIIIHCGGCMLTRHEKLKRMSKAREKAIPISNYGIVISMLHGVLERVLEPFPDVLDVYRKDRRM